MGFIYGAEWRDFFVCHHVHVYVLKGLCDMEESSWIVWKLDRGATIGGRGGFC